MVALAHHWSPTRQHVSPVQPQRRRCYGKNGISFLPRTRATTEVCPWRVAARRRRLTIGEKSPVPWLPSSLGYARHTRGMIGRMPTTMHKELRGGELMDWSQRRSPVSRTGRTGALVHADGTDIYTCRRIPLRRCSLPHGAHQIATDTDRFGWARGFCLGWLQTRRWLHRGERDDRLGLHDRELTRGTKSSVNGSAELKGRMGHGCKGRTWACTLKWAEIGPNAGILFYSVFIF
jgi:hypothetical protein